VTEKTHYEWRHGWIPLTLHAAILKAHGNHERAEELLAAGREHRAARAEHGPGFVTPLHAAHDEHTARRRLRSMSDDDLADAMGDADDDALAVLVDELDRRDRAAKKAAAAADRRARRRGERDAAREADYDRRVEAGEDPEAAYAAAYGITEERVRRDEAIASLRSAGYEGKGLDELTRAAFRDHVETTYRAAEDETRGVLVTAAGERAGVHPRDLFTGPEARARKYATEELLSYWQTHGRLTVEDFRAGILGGHMRSSSSRGTWA
jgi:hypothetical protein